MQTMSIHLLNFKSISKIKLPFSVSNKFNILYSTTWERHLMIFNSFFFVFLCYMYSGGGDCVCDCARAYTCRGKRGKTEVGAN